MLVQESLPVAAALERRLQVERITALDRPVPIGAPGDDRATADPRLPSGRGDAPALRPSLSGAGVAAPSTSPSAAPSAALTARLPIGDVVVARVVEVPHPALVIAELDDLRVELAWPPARVAVPQPGDDVALQVVAHVPVLVVRTVGNEEAIRVDIDAAGAAPDDGARPVWSDDALRLQRRLVGGTSPAMPAGVLRGERAASPLAAARAEGEPPVGRDAGAIRFDVPILAVDDAGAARDQPVGDIAIRDPRTTAAPSVPPTAGDGEATSRARTVADATTVGPFVPVLLQGPAWVGQPMELVVRRERADDAFDNPVLDHWCGEVVIDLPQLGRVAGHLSFSMQGLRIRIEGDDDAGVAAMADATGELAAALADADLRVVGLTVAHPSADTRRATPSTTDFLRTGLGFDFDG